MGLNKIPGILSGNMISLITTTFNKNLDSNVKNVQLLAEALDELATLAELLTTQGDIPYASAANTPARLAKGSKYKALYMNSGVTAPEWQYPAWCKIASTTVGAGGAASVSFTSIESGFRYFKIMFDANLDGASASGQLLLRFNSDSTADHYEYCRLMNAAGAVSGSTNTLSTSIDVGSVTASVYGTAIGEILISNTLSSRIKQVSASIGKTKTARNIITNGSWLNTANEISQINLFTSSDKFAQYSTFELWGCK